MHIKILYTKYFAVIDFSQSAFEMTTLCHSEVSAEESVTLKGLIYNVIDPSSVKLYIILLWLGVFGLFSILPAKDELPAVPPGAIAPVDTLFHRPLSRGLALVYQDSFPAAVALFDSLKSVFPDHPAPNFYLAATYQTWMSSYRFNGFQKELEANVQQAIDKGNELLEVRGDDPWLNFYIGAAYGYRAFFRVRSFNWIGAYLDGKKGIGNFQRALEKAPALYDVYLGLGSYHYWRTARSKFIRVIAFWMSDKRDFGLEQIDFSIRHGRYCPAESFLVLATAQFDYGRYEAALQTLQEFHHGHRPVMSSRYLEGRLRIEAGEWAEVERIFSDLLARLEPYPYPSVGYQVECRYWIARARAEQGDAMAALELCRKALALADTRDQARELESQFESFDDIKSMLEDLEKTLMQRLQLH